MRYCLIPSVRSFSERSITGGGASKGLFLERLMSSNDWLSGLKKCCASSVRRLVDKKSLRASAEFFKVCLSWGSRSVRSISFATKASRNSCSACPDICLFGGELPLSCFCRSSWIILGGEFNLCSASGSCRRCWRSRLAIFRHIFRQKTKA